MSSDRSLFTVNFGVYFKFRRNLLNQSRHLLSSDDVHCDKPSRRPLNSGRLCFMFQQDKDMSQQIKIIFRAGVIVIWLVSFFWFVFFAISFLQGLGFLPLVIAVGALFMGLIGIYFWRQVFSIKTKTRYGRQEQAVSRHYLLFAIFPEIVIVSQMKLTD